MGADKGQLIVNGCNEKTNEKRTLSAAVDAVVSVLSIMLLFFVAR